MTTLLQIVYWLLHLYSLLFLVRAILSWARPAENRWTVLLRCLTEPALTPVRKLLARLFPNGTRMFDFSPVVVILILELLGQIVQSMIWRSLIR